MPGISPRLGEFLIKTTKSKDIDDAFKRVLSEYLELKLRVLNETIKRLEDKWGMDFYDFKEKVRSGTLPRDAFSFDVEQDFWEWEESVTLKRHYESLKEEWI